MFPTKLTNFIQGISVTKEKEQRVVDKWQIKKGHTVIGEAFCRKMDGNIKIQIIRRINPVGRGLMTVLLKEIQMDAKKQNRDLKIEVKPFNDPNRPYETPTQARKRVYKWYKSFGFEIDGENGIYRN